MLELECEQGSLINLVRANYGRFSISICNGEGNTAWSVNCMEPRTLRMINNRYKLEHAYKIGIKQLTLIGLGGLNQSAAFSNVHFSMKKGVWSSQIS